jgi:hypothetical protein
MERCPNCRARRETGETCRRCGMDLGPLLAVERAAGSLIARALVQLAAGESEAAIRSLTQTRGLCAEPLIGHLLGFARGLPMASSPVAGVSPGGCAADTTPGRDGSGR